MAVNAASKICCEDGGASGASASIGACPVHPRSRRTRRGSVLQFSREPRDQHRLDLDPLLVDLFRSFADRPEARRSISISTRSAASRKTLTTSWLRRCFRLAKKPSIRCSRFMKNWARSREPMSRSCWLACGSRPARSALLLDRLEYDAADGASAWGCTAIRRRGRRSKKCWPRFPRKTSNCGARFSTRWNSWTRRSRI